MMVGVTSTPLWVPLLLAGLGLVGTVSGTIGGVLITQRGSDRRETLALTRQEEREREAWAREDSARTFEHRRQAYGDFYESLKAMALRVYNHGMGLSDEDDEELPEGWQTHTFQRLQHLELYATWNVRVRAGEAYSTVWRWGAQSQVRYGRPGLLPRSRGSRRGRVRFAGGVAKRSGDPR